MKRSRLTFRPILAWALLLLVSAISLPCIAATNSVPDIVPAPEDHYWTLKLANRPIFDFRATIGDYTAEERRAAAEVRLKNILAKNKTILVTTQAIPGGIQVCLDDMPLFIVTPEDVPEISGETVDTAASKAMTALQKAMVEMHSFKSISQLFTALGLALLFTAIFVGLVWVIGKARTWIRVRLTKLVASKTENVKSRELRRVGLKSFILVMRAVLNLVSWVFIAYISYTWLTSVMRCFPYSRPWGEYLNSHVIMAELTLGRDVLVALPDIVIVVLIVLVARMIIQICNNLFEAVEEGDVQTQWLDVHTASTTRRILVFFVWVVAIVVAYPYIPGSNTLAFKGVTVFAGLIISLGSSSLVSQIASGLLLIYSRAYRPGDFVRFGDTEGTVIGVGFFSTFIRTTKNEEIHIANNVLISATTKNYSRLSESQGLLLPTRVTIGYTTPWRQVEAMLIEAANRTQGLLPDPKPFVLQVSLSDFYVEYELNVRLEVPNQRMIVLGKLHANIQDVFNENGVQIMSPHYRSDPPKPQVVPKSDWFAPPAQREENS